MPKDNQSELFVVVDKNDNIVGYKTRAKFIMQYEIETEMDTIYSGTYNGPFQVDRDEVEKVEFYSANEIKKMTNKLTPFAKRSLKEVKIL